MRLVSIPPPGLLGIALLGAVLVAIGACPAAAPAAGDRLAPEFPRSDAGGLLNSPPLTMAGLLGRVVVLDLWTFG